MRDYPFPTVIDSSMVSAFRSCPRKAELEYFAHWKPRDESVHLHAGKAFARGLEVARLSFFESGEDPETSIALGVGALLEAYGTFTCPEDSAKSATRMAGALEYYFSVWPLGSDSAEPHIMPSGRRGIEFSFLEPIDFPHPVTGEPILYAGRFDQIVDFAGGVFGEDDKTTSSLGATWPKQWDMRSQFTSYCWGAQQGGLHLQGFLVRGVGILKTKFDSMPAVTYRPQWMIDRWYETLLTEDLPAMVRMWESGKFRYSLDGACTEYRGCMFKTPCLSFDPAPWLEIGFIRRRWDPVTRLEEVLE
jgi:hypothetical protein